MLWKLVKIKIQDDLIKMPSLSMFFIKGILTSTNNELREVNEFSKCMNMNK